MGVASMAAWQQRGGSFRVLFRFRGKQHAFNLGAVTKAEAEAKTDQVDYLLMRLKQRLIELPADADIVEFVQFDGKMPSSQLPAVPSREKIGLSDLGRRYAEAIRASVEASTVGMVELHFRHLVRHLGEAFPVKELRHADLQRYVDRRAKEPGIKGRKLSPVTIEKELVSFESVRRRDALSCLVPWAPEAQGVCGDVGKFTRGAAFAGVLAGVGGGTAGVGADGRGVLCGARRGPGGLLRVAETAGGRG
jgi:hypothetical protein